MVQVWRWEANFAQLVHSFHFYPGSRDWTQVQQTFLYAELPCQPHYYIDYVYIIDY